MVDTDKPTRVLRSPDDATPEWLGRVLGVAVSDVATKGDRGDWSDQFRLGVRTADGSELALRLKLCLGRGFGPSEVHYYRRDYVDLPDAPLVRCHDAAFEPGVGYHVLLDDLTNTHRNRRDIEPTRAYALALAAALARLHRHHLHSRPPADERASDRYLAEIRPGIGPIAAATGLNLAHTVEAHIAVTRARWANPSGQTLLHGDINPMNILTPADADGPPLFLDRQPFDWSLTYGLALYDLAYATALWWPPDRFREYQADMLACWFDTLDARGYSWSHAREDWRLSVEQCRHVPLEWCSKPETLGKMRSLWEWQLKNVDAAVTTLE